MYLGAEHGGFKFKEKIKKFLDELKVEYQDLGNSELEPQDDFVDYASAVANKVAETGGKGILTCTNGLGVCIAANKIKGIRAALVATRKVAEQSREHLNSNVLCLGAHIISFKNAKKIIKAWIGTEFFQRERYIRRIEKIDNLEK